jgi:hypothetical protein
MSILWNELLPDTGGHEAIVPKTNLWDEYFKMLEDASNAVETMNSIVSSLKRLKQSKQNIDWGELLKKYHNELCISPRYPTDKVLGDEIRLLDIRFHSTQDIFDWFKGQIGGGK